MKPIDEYSVNMKTKTIIIIKDFADRAGRDINSPEHATLKRLHSEYDGFTIKYRKRISAKKQTHKNLNLAHMEQFIKRFDNKSLEKFAEVTEYHKTSTAYFSKIKSWFLKQYPNYREIEQKFDYEETAAAEIAKTENSRKRRQYKYYPLRKTRRINKNLTSPIYRTAPVI
jgi:hypothetical protein